MTIRKPAWVKTEQQIGHQKSRSVLSACSSIINWLFRYKVVLTEVVSISTVNWNCTKIPFTSNMSLLTQKRSLKTTYGTWTHGTQADEKRITKQFKMEWLNVKWNGWSRGRKRTVTIHDTLVNKVHNLTTQESNRSFDTSGWRQSCFGMETCLNSSLKR